MIHLWFKLHPRANPSQPQKVAEPWIPRSPPGAEGPVRRQISDGSPSPHGPGVRSEPCVSEPNREKEEAGEPILLFDCVCVFVFVPFCSCFFFGGGGGETLHDFHYRWTIACGLVSTQIDLETIL